MAFTISILIDNVQQNPHSKANCPTLYRSILWWNQRYIQV